MASNIKDEFREQIILQFEGFDYPIDKEDRYVRTYFMRNNRISVDGAELTTSQLVSYDDPPLPHSEEKLIELNFPYSNVEELADEAIYKLEESGFFN